MHDFSTEYRLTDGSTTFSQEEWINDIKAQAWEEGLEAKFKLLDGEDSISLTNPYRQGERSGNSNSQPTAETSNLLNKGEI